MTANHRAQPVSCDPLYGLHKISKLATGLLLASAYEIWPPEYRPQYTPEELRRLARIAVEEVAAQLGISRTGAYEAVRHEIPAIQLPSTDRWVVPEDAAVRMEAYDLRNFTLMFLPEHRQEVQPLESEADDPATGDEVVVEDATNAPEVEFRDLGLATQGTMKISDTCERAVRTKTLVFLEARAPVALR